MMSERKIGEVILEVKNISLAFGGVKALTVPLRPSSNFTCVSMYWFALPA